MTINISISVKPDVERNLFRCPGSHALRGNQPASTLRVAPSDAERRRRCVPTRSVGTRGEMPTRCGPFGSQGRLRPFPPKAVLGPAFTPGERTDRSDVSCPAPFTGLLLRPTHRRNRRATRRRPVNGPDCMSRSGVINPASMPGLIPPAAETPVNGREAERIASLFAPIPWAETPVNGREDSGRRPLVRQAQGNALGSATTVTLVRPNGPAVRCV